MGIANIRPSHRDHHPDNPGVARDDYDSVSSNNQECKLRDIGGIADTSPWVVDYYGQVLGEDDSVHHSDVGLSPVYQQYCKIVDYTLRMSSPLPDAEAVVLEGVIPNVGDVVVSRNDRPWLFLRVVEVEAVMPRENPNYVIKLAEFGYTDETDVNYIDLQNKSSCTLVGKSDGSLVTADKKEVDTRLMKYYCTVADNYFRTFVDSDTDMLMFKWGDEVQLYDHHLSKLCQRTVEAKFWRYKYGFRLVHVHEEKPFNTVLSTLMDIQIPMLLSRVHDKVGIIGRKETKSNIGVANFLHTPATHICETDDVIQLEDLNEQSLKDVILDDPKVYPDIDGSPDIISVLSDASYILTEGYYADNDTGLSLLEKMVLQYRLEKTVEPEHVEQLYNGYADWEDVDRFYFTPILLLFTLIAIGDY